MAATWDGWMLCAVLCCAGFPTWKSVRRSHTPPTIPPSSSSTVSSRIATTSDPLYSIQCIHPGIARFRSGSHEISTCMSADADAHEQLPRLRPSRTSDTRSRGPVMGLGLGLGTGKARRRPRVDGRVEHLDGLVDRCRLKTAGKHKPCSKRKPASRRAPTGELEKSKLCVNSRAPLTTSGEHQVSSATQYDALARGQVIPGPDGREGEGEGEGGGREREKAGEGLSCNLEFPGKSQANTRQILDKPPTHFIAVSISGGFDPRYNPSTSRRSSRLTHLPRYCIVQYLPNHLISCGHGRLPCDRTVLFPAESNLSPIPSTASHHHSLAAWHPVTT